MNWLKKTANIGFDLSNQYSDKYRDLSSRRINMRKELHRINPPRTYQDQLLMYAKIAEESIPLYEDLVSWMESQTNLANQDTQFRSKWQDAIKSTHDIIASLHEDIEYLSSPFKIEDYDIDEIIEWYVDNDVDIIPILDQYNIDYSEVEFPLAKVIVFDTGQTWVYEGGSLTEAHDWVDQAEPYEYFNPSIDDDFWADDLNGLKVYHATSRENAEFIMKDGLMTMDESRGLSNNSTGPAVFTSENSDDIDSYGEVVFEIDVGAMQYDGYKIPVSREEPIEEQELKHKLAFNLELDDYYWEVDSDMSPTTLIFHGPIPAKYIKIYG